MENKNRERLLLVLTGGVVVLWILNWLIVTPLTNSWHKRSDYIVQLHKQLNDGTQLLRRESVIRDSWDRMNTNALSSTSTVAEQQLFNAFDRWVRESRVIQSSFKPQLRQTDDNYSVMECHAEVTGEYSAIVRFLYDLESDPMGVQITGVDLTSRDDAGRQISLGIDLSGLLQPPGS